MFGHSAKLKSISLLCVCVDLWCVCDGEEEGEEGRDRIWFMADRLY